MNSEVDVQDFQKVFEHLNQFKCSNLPQNLHIRIREIETRLPIVDF